MGLLLQYFNTIQYFNLICLEDILHIKVFVDVLKLQEQINPGDMFGWIFNLFIYMNRPNEQIH